MGLDRYEREIQQLLAEHHAELVQEHPHRKWRLPDGRSFVMSFSPSCRFATRNALRELRKLLGIKRESPTGRTVRSEPELQNVKPQLTEQQKKIAREVSRVLAERPLTGPLRPSLREQLQQLKEKI